MKGYSNLPSSLADNINLHKSSGGLPVVIPPYVNLVADIYETGKIVNLYRLKSCAGVGLISMFLLPDNEYWTIIGGHAALATGTYTISAIYIQLPETNNYTWVAINPASWTPNSNKFWYPVFTAGQTTIMWKATDKDIRIPPASTIGVQCDAYTGTGNLTLQLQIRREIYE